MSRDLLLIVLGFLSGGVVWPILELVLNWIRAPRALDLEQIGRLQAENEGLRHQADEAQRRLQTPPPTDLNIPRGFRREALAFQAQDPRPARESFEVLKPFIDPKYTATCVAFATMAQKPTAARIVALFNLINWPVELRSTPLEGAMFARPEYHHGIEVRGYNKELVTAVAGAIEGAGFAGVRSTVEVPKVRQDSHKWPWAQHRVDIWVGHTDA